MVTYLPGRAAWPVQRQVPVNKAEMLASQEVALWPSQLHISLEPVILFTVAVAWCDFVAARRPRAAAGRRHSLVVKERRVEGCSRRLLVLGLSRVMAAAFG